MPPLRKLRPARRLASISPAVTARHALPAPWRPTRKCPGRAGSALDPFHLEGRDLIFELKRDTIVIVTHNMQQAARVRSNGSSTKLIETGATTPVRTDRKTNEEDYITGSLVVRRVLDTPSLVLGIVEEE